MGRRKMDAVAFKSAASALTKATVSRRFAASWLLAPSNDVDSTLGNRSILRAVAAALKLATS